MNPEQEIRKLKDGEVWEWPESDYGKAEIWLKNETYFLFAIPMYGGQPCFEQSYNKGRIGEMVATVESWT